MSWPAVTSTSGSVASVVPDCSIVMSRTVPPARTSSSIRSWLLLWFGATSVSRSTANGSHVVSVPVASSPEALLCPAGQGTQALLATRSFVGQ